MNKIRTQTGGYTVPQSTQDLPRISRLYGRFLREGPRRGDGCFARDPQETAVRGMTFMLPETHQQLRVAKTFT
jgi:hypothetical protein